MFSKQKLRTDVGGIVLVGTIKFFNNLITILQTQSSVTNDLAHTHARGVRAVQFIKTIIGGSALADKQTVALPIAVCAITGRALPIEAVLRGRVGRVYSEFWVNDFVS